MSIEIHQHPFWDRRFNAGAWDHDGQDFLVARKVPTTPVAWGKPDTANMVMIVHHEDGTAVERTIWEVNESKDHSIEDARVLKDGDNLYFGVTAVKERAGLYIPHPAVVRWTQQDAASDKMLPDPFILEAEDGKCTTPLQRTPWNPNPTFIFRPESRNHLLRVFEIDDQNNTSFKPDIHFPEDIPWAQVKIGTTAPPIPINETDSLMIFHGISMDDQNRYVYSIGKAILKSFPDGHYELGDVDYKPLITPDLFADKVDQDGQPLVDELHQERRVVYVCGSRLRRINGKLVLGLFVNIGDRRTVEVRFLWTDLVDAPYISQLSNTTPDLSSVA